MKQIFHIAFLDIKIMVRDKIFFFWTLVFPLVFIFIFGNMFQGDQKKQTHSAELQVLNQDTGQWGDYFIKKLEAPTIALKLVQKEPEKYNRLLIIPTDFSQKLESRTAQNLMLKKRDGANMKAAAQVEVKIIQATAKLITEMILHPDNETFFKEKSTFKDIIEIKAMFPQNTVKKIPSGFDHVIPGIMVQFILMMVFIYGGVTVMMDRKRGTLSRMLYSSVSIAQLWSGKFLGRLMMGMLQALILIATGILFFNLNLGNPILSILNILVFAIAASSLSIFFGSVIGKEDLLVGVSVLTANLFSALGGCWWPMEVVPQTFKTVGMISPAYWAMDAFHKIIFFNKGLSDLLINFLVLLGFTAAFTILAIKFFKIKD